jgi:uncharacterized repeat protein (TIGR03847 family)
MTAYDEPDAFTAGAVGPAGERVFYLQIQHEGDVTAVKLEKQQVLALAEYLAGLLHDLPPPSTVPPAPDLVEPVDAEWTVGTIGVAYDNDRDRIVIVADELVPEDDPPGSSLRVAITRAQVRALIDKAEELMVGGRPPCRLCGAPIDPSGHACPRAN